LGCQQAFLSRKFRPYFVEIKPATITAATARPSTFDIAILGSGLRLGLQR
jgi:hypothetical protein